MISDSRNIRSLKSLEYQSFVVGTCLDIPALKYLFVHSSFWSCKLIHLSYCATRFFIYTIWNLFFCGLNIRCVFSPLFPEKLMVLLWECERNVFFRTEYFLFPFKMLFVILECLGFSVRCLLLLILHFFNLFVIDSTVLGIKF